MSLASSPLAPVEVRTLGGFVVLRHGDPVLPSEWQSKKARDLLKLLVARRGHPVPRDLLAEALWPGGDPAKTANRLSVALWTVRGVLDLQHNYGRHHFIVAGNDTVAVRLGAVDVDVELFLANAKAGLAEPSPGSRRHALLEAAESAYQGDFLEEDIYEDWALPLREEARCAYAAVARALAREAADLGDHDTAARYRLRVLERDPYDEQAHLELVCDLAVANRHGEARRAYLTYVARMGDIGVEPVPMPARPPRRSPTELRQPRHVRPVASLGPV